MSATGRPSGPVTSEAIAWPTITPYSVATSTSVPGPVPHMARSTAEVGGATGEKNLRNRERSDRPMTNDLIASPSAAEAARISTGPPRCASAGG